MDKAKWGIGYDYRSDKCYRMPIHNDECDAPIIYDDELETYICIGCGEEVELDDEMKALIDRARKSKTEVEECFSCGKKTMETVYRRNEATGEWQACHGVCSNCGIRFIV